MNEALLRVTFQLFFSFRAFSNSKLPLLRLVARIRLKSTNVLFLENGRTCPCPNGEILIYFFRILYCLSVIISNRNSFPRLTQL